MQIRRQLTPKMQPSAISVLLPEYRRRVLGLLLLHPDDALHGREIARRAGLPAGTVTRELVKLADAGLLQRERRGNQQIYSANKAHPIFAELASILRKTSGLADVLIDALAPVADQLRAAFPQVEIESCSSGGGRIDFGVMERTQRVWLSDSNDALERQRIQHELPALKPAHGVAFGL